MSCNHKKSCAELVRLHSREIRYGACVSDDYDVPENVDQVDIVDVDDADEGVRISLGSSRKLRQVLINNVSGIEKNSDAGPVYVEACDQIIGVDAEGDFLLPPNTSALFTFTCACVWIVLLYTTPAPSA